MSFNIDDVPESKEFEFTLLPEGGYRVVIATADFKYKQGNTSSNWFSLSFDVLPYSGAGEYDLAGRKLFINLTWENANTTAVEIGRGKLADLMFAVSAKSFNYPSELIPQLLNKELYVQVGHKPRKDTGAMETDIKGFWSVGGRQRRKEPKPIPVPPSAQAIATAPAQAPKQAPRYSSDPGFGDADVPF